MIQAFYNGVVGAQQQMLRMNVQANNMANINTGGFKAQQTSFQTLLYRDVTGIDGAQLPKGSGTLVVATTVDYSHSSVEATGRKQDYSILGDGFFALYEPATQQVSLTRDGAFTVSQFLEMDENEEPITVYYLTDGEGRQVLGQDGYPIQVTDPEAEQPVGIFEVQYQSGLQHLDSSRFITTEKSGAIYLSDSKALQGTLEESNADMATEMSKVIEAQRTYSYALKMVTTADEMETTINNLTNG